MTVALRAVESMTTTCELMVVCRAQRRQDDRLYAFCWLLLDIVLLFEKSVRAIEQRRSPEKQSTWEWKLGGVVVQQRHHMRLCSPAEALPNQSSFPPRPRPRPRPPSPATPVRCPRYLSRLTEEDFLLTVSSQEVLLLFGFLVHHGMCVRPPASLPGLPRPPDWKLTRIILICTEQSL